MNHARKSLRLYLANRWWTLATPIFILLIMVALSVAVAVIVRLATGEPLTAEIQEGFRENNAGAIWSVPGFLISVGAISMNHGFSLALALGSSRRDFWLGTSLGFLTTSLAVGAGSVLFLALELLTGHWWIGAHAFDVAMLGRGNYLQTFATMTVFSLLSLYIGAFFGTVFRAWGSVWTTVSAIGAALLLLASIALVAIGWERVGPVVETLGTWSIVVGMGLACAAFVTGSVITNRRATI